MQREWEKSDIADHASSVRPIRAIRAACVRCILALVTRDLILAFPVTYLAKTRQTLLWSDAEAEDAIVWSTLLSILPSLTDEEDVSAGRRGVLIA